MTTETRKAIAAVEKRLEELEAARSTGQIVLMVEQGRPTWVRLQQDERLSKTPPCNVATR